MERKLASIQRVRAIKPIDGADAIEVVQINSWNVVAKKGEFAEGDLCVYFEIDSFLPMEKDFEFLRKSSYKKMGDLEGFRLKTIRLRGQVSQGLCLPLSVLEKDDEMKIGLSKKSWGDQLQLGPYDDAIVIEEGADVTEYMCVLKYEPPVPAELAGKVKGGFPSFIHKTDEERVQNLTDHYESWKDHAFYVTEKLDGSSATFYLNHGEFGVCSRNLDLLETAENTFWKVAREMELKSKLESVGYNICIQGELVGEGIQKNSYKLRGQTVKFFNAFNIDTQEYLGFEEFTKLVLGFGLPIVPIVETKFTLPDTIDQLLEYADSKSALNPTFDREGVVIRSLDRKISFKVISNKFLLNEA